MSDSYQAIYDAVRSRISGGNVAEAVERVAHQAFDISHYAALLHQEFSIAAYQMQRPSAVFKPRIFPDGNQWCALLGDNLQEGVAGFGDSPELACEAFDKAWHEKRARQEHDMSRDPREIAEEILDGFTWDGPVGSDLAAAIAAAIERDRAEREAWLPIETAPRDGTPVLLLLKNPLPVKNRPDLDRWHGIPFVGRKPALSDYPHWNFAAPVGQGGFPDEWIAGWQPLPSPLRKASRDDPRNGATPA